MGQGGAFVELITVRRGAYSRRYIQTALKVVVINPRAGYPFARRGDSALHLEEDRQEDEPPRVAPSWASESARHATSKTSALSRALRIQLSRIRAAVTDPWSAIVETCRILFRIRPRTLSRGIIYRAAAQERAYSEK